MAGQPKVLIVYGYHRREIFATDVGKYLVSHHKNSDIKIVIYGGRRDRERSNRNLRQFIAGLDPALAIILHGDDDIEVDAAIWYYAKSKQERDKVLEPLFDSTLKYIRKGYCLEFDIFITPNAKYSIIEVELNSKMGLERAVDYIRDLSKYLIKKGL